MRRFPLTNASKGKTIYFERICAIFQHVQDAEIDSCRVVSSANHRLKSRFS